MAQLWVLLLTACAHAATVRRGGAAERPSAKVPVKPMLLADSSGPIRPHTFLLEAAAEQPSARLGVGRLRSFIRGSLAKQLDAVFGKRAGKTVKSRVERSLSVGGLAFIGYSSAAHSKHIASGLVRVQALSGSVVERLNFLPLAAYHLFVSTATSSKLMAAPQALLAGLYAGIGLAIRGLRMEKQVLADRDEKCPIPKIFDLLPGQVARVHLA